jgi:hypothetical protein
MQNVAISTSVALRGVTPRQRQHMAAKIEPRQCEQARVGNLLEHAIAQRDNDHGGDSAALRPAHRVRVAFPMDLSPEGKDVALRLLAREKPQSSFDCRALGLETSGFHGLGKQAFVNVDIRTYTSIPMCKSVARYTHWPIRATSRGKAL